MAIKKIYLDVETTGTDKDKHGIIQLSGMVELDNQLMETFDYKVKPFSLDDVDQDALKVGGFTDSQLATFERPGIVYFKFSKMLDSYVDKYNKQDKFHIIAYNAGFDDGFLRAWFKRNGGKYYGSYFFWPPIDVANMAAYHFMETRSQFPNFKLMTVAKYIGIEVDESRAHDAMYDIEVTKEILKRIVEAKHDSN